MRDIRKYWQEIRALEARLPEYLWVVDALGALVEVTAHIAAKLLHAKSHREATAEEIRAHLAKLGAANRETARVAMRRRGVDKVALD